MIKIEKLTHKYLLQENDKEQEILALHEVDIKITAGEFVAIIGHNGSGKSTLARHLNALLLPTEGKCYVGGRDTSAVDNLWEIRSRVGMVFQNPDNQSVAAIVEEDVAFGPENIGVEPIEIRRRVDEALAITGLTEYRLHAPHLLSGGQKQRLAIASVLAMRPQVIVFDEATAMLDPRGRKEIMTMAKRLNHDEGLTVVMVTHFMEEAAMANRVIVMDKGAVLMDGSPEMVFAEVDVLRSIGLAAPLPSEMGYRLRHWGVDISTGILSNESFVDNLCRLF